MLGVLLSWAAVTDPGLVRQKNEDSVLAEAGIFVVADGMGGHSAGDVASSITVEELRETAKAGAAQQGSAVPRAIRDANSRIRAIAGQRVIGSTVTGLALSEFGQQPTWLVWNVGDSRCYRIEAGEIEQITTDHTLVAEMLATGELSVEDIPHHPDRHVITRAVGADDEVQPDYWLLRPAAGERFVLCSDGLTNELTDAEILAAVAAAESPATAAIALLTAALEHGGHDNVSAVVVFCLSVGGASDMQTADDQTTPREILCEVPAHDAEAPVTQQPPNRPFIISEVPS